ncbi:MAG TPA: hypothetical protein VHT26_16970 [Trebonia sp.]|nr:hypothetical protein [Trebonia sp.]
MLAILGIVVLAACSGGTTSASADSSTSTAYQKALAYAQCIRAHGIPDYPDPNSQGQFIIQNGSSDFPTESPAVANAASKACRSLIPPSLAQGPSAGSSGQGSGTSKLQFSECMRSHGVPNFPDPASNGSFTLPPGMNTQSTKFQNASKACGYLNNPGGESAS